MAKTTAAAFTQFNDIIKPSSATWDKVSMRCDAVVKVLKEAFPEDSPISYQEHLLIGSLGRNTATSPVADIDLLTVFDINTFSWAWRNWWTSAHFLHRVRRLAHQESTVKKIGARGQAVRFFYTDGLHVDVAAVLRHSNGGFKIPDGSGGWLRTDPRRHEEYLNSRNKAVSGDLRQLIRFAREWNKEHGGHLGSFHLEMLTARTFDALGTNYRQALRDFFDYNRRRLSVTDPAGYSGNLARRLSWDDVSTVKASLRKARDRADLALEAEERGDHAEAMRQWRIILGKKFPTYG